MNKSKYFLNFFEYIENGLQKRGETVSVAEEVDRLEREGGIPAQKMPRKGKFEEIFTSEFLVKEIAGFHFSSAFQDSFDLDNAVHEVAARVFETIAIDSLMGF